MNDIVLKIKTIMEEIIMIKMSYRELKDLITQCVQGYSPESIHIYP